MAHPFRRLLILTPIWLAGTLALVGLSIKVIRQVHYHQQTPLAQASQVQPTPVSTVLPQHGQVKGISTIVEGADARAEIVANFLERHDSPLLPHDYFGQKIVEIADTYDIDYRLLPAIAMQESNLCKKIPAGSYNCLGFGIHARGTLGFDSYEANFDRAARELKKNYIDIGLDTPEKIMRKYTPSSNGSWAESVNQWIAEMEYNDRESGREKKIDADLHEYVGE